MSDATHACIHCGTASAIKSVVLTRETTLRVIERPAVCDPRTPSGNTRDLPSGAVVDGNDVGAEQLGVLVMYGYGSYVQAP